MAEVLRIENLSFAYDNGTLALANLSLRVKEGETVAFIGPNGAGKTTLFLYILGLLHRTPREVTVMGQTLSSPQAVEAVRGQVGLVFQNPEDQLFCTTVFDDVAFGPINQGLSAAEVKERVAEALAAVGLEGFEHRVPHHLSGGEQRRVALATIYAMHPRIVLLDEPTSNLDPRGKQEVTRLLKQFPGTQLIATHDYELVLTVADRVVLLNQGRIIANGPPLEILANETLLKANGLEMPLVMRYFLALKSQAVADGCP
ncbi:MAG: energy-coupling factor ABC transporter ATP-binding protein [Deltaproteobacteria bacterium]|nr:energy-coupling factor ABC transporter ATP-binding protein [Deltaproteobacteria bacterium]